MTAHWRNSVDTEPTLPPPRAAAAHQLATTHPIDRTAKHRTRIIAPTAHFVAEAAHGDDELRPGSVSTFSRRRFT
ncbi:MAG: hypothetical protein ACLUE1_09915 [Adlercreutzia equolifaciens]